MGERYLFDASALVDLVLGLGPESVDIGAVFGEHVLDLTMYEAGNALRKIRFAKDALTDEELDEALDILGRLNREVTFERATETLLRPTMDMARQTGATFYDASYITVAEGRGLTLVTEDGPQQDAADKAEVTAVPLAELD
ncbi:type II toxin-antitoxin system VapC family toxin [Halococcus sediminicola]|uniref:type II toxin-antitoxin system VapC family toxin n=1 Tax=Halococcus sediminicola TaxID=1264579 RepID=UPI00067886CF|nr:type II toxin-antitoxin system VapC family toxin [Halococcus sediminicola]